MDKIRVRAVQPVLGLARGDVVEVWPTRRIEVLVDGGQLDWLEDDDA